MTLPEIHRTLIKQGVSEPLAFRVVDVLLNSGIIQEWGMTEDGQPLYVPRHQSENVVYIW